MSSLKSKCFVVRAIFNCFGITARILLWVVSLKRSLEVAVILLSYEGGSEGDTGVLIFWLCMICQARNCLGFCVQARGGGLGWKERGRGRREGGSYWPAAVRLDRVFVFFNNGWHWWDLNLNGTCISCILKEWQRDRQMERHIDRHTWTNWCRGTLNGKKGKRTGGGTDDQVGGWT